ncbi:MAG: LamG domain-containing protein, partial [Pseudomonadota bacterium]
MFPLTLNRSRNRGVISAAAAAVADPLFDYVSLLLNTTSTNGAQNNTFLDSSTNNFSITRNGNTTQGTFSPFNPTAAWDAGTNGGSGYFDGTGDDLRSANAGAAANLGATWTVELWVYPSNVSGTGAIVNVNINTANTGVNIYRNGATITVDDGVTGGTGPSGGTLVANTWQHVAVVADGTNTKIYLNGTQVGSTFSGTVTLGTPTHFWVGASFSGLSNWTGYLSNARIVKGTAVYTAAFTPPTAPLTAITNTSLLCNFTNAGIFDSASGNDLETVGNAQVSTTQAKWGTTSMAFDGTGDWLLNIDKPALRLGTAAFTIEM